MIWGKLKPKKALTHEVTTHEPNDAAEEQSSAWGNFKNKTHAYVRGVQEACQEARDDVVHRMQFEIDALPEGEDKEIKAKALEMAELKASALALVREATAMEREAVALEQTPDGTPGKLLKSKAAKMIRLKAKTKQSEAESIRTEYELGRVRLDPRASEQEHAMEVTFLSDIIEAEAVVRHEVQDNPKPIKRRTLSPLTLSPITPSPQSHNAIPTVP